MKNDLVKTDNAKFPGNRALPASWAIAALAVASAAHGQSLFARTTNTAAAHGVEIVGLAIVLFTGATSLGVLIGGVWTMLHRRAEARAHRR